MDECTRAHLRSVRPFIRTIRHMHITFFLYIFVVVVLIVVVVIGDAVVVSLSLHLRSFQIESVFT